MTPWIANSEFFVHLLLLLLWFFNTKPSLKVLDFILANAKDIHTEGLFFIHSWPWRLPR